ncbi:MAG: [FeFe] hydrogenase H-cluster radical SAM maturase HydE [Clostridiales bacterium]|nr:[FeFe] hydrogenase H-cluster radical SAM maturase HydE [Clostridiales bacterium]
MNINEIIQKLYDENNASNEELLYLLNNIDDNSKDFLLKKSHETSLNIYGNKVYMRGLIEFTNYCVRNCKYCGIRKDNNKAERYRLSKEEILACAKQGDKLGYKTFVLQGGEDPFFTDEKLIEIIKEIKKEFPRNAITLSLGERSFESYKRLFDAGADRYLLRHETASKKLYESLHPGASLENRINCLYNLKKIGYQVGAGFMVEIPNQTNENLVEDLVFLKKLNPAMVGIGPFIPHKDTPLRDEKAGTLEKTIILLGIIRLLLPDVLLPATTALGTINKNGREMGLKAGANVVMPNLSPTSVREKYSLYNGKICTGDEAAECRKCIEGRINRAGFQVEINRGDNINFQKEKVMYL